MNLQMFEPAIAPHISGTRQWCASRSVRLVISLLAGWLFAMAAFAFDPQKSIANFVFTSGDIYRLREGERQHVMRGMRAEVWYGRTAIRSQT
jgi:hypothetical protein